MKKILIITCAILFFSCKENNISNDTIIEKNLDADLKQDKDTLRIRYIPDTSRTMEDYKNNILKAKEVLNNKNTLDNIAVESIIPVNIEEFRFFYGLTYSTEEDWIFFEKINVLILQKAQSDSGNCIEKYSNLAEFVDGEYAEGFYDDILSIAERNPNKFCNIFENLSTDSKKNLLEAYKEVCNN